MRTPNLIEAYQAIKDCREYIEPTPVLSSKILSDAFYKLEFLNPTGSFKWRGAVNALVSLSKTEGGAGGRRYIVCASTGNHGLAVATISKLLGYEVEIVVSELTPLNKVKALQDQGAQVRQVGKSQDEAFEVAHRIVEEKGGFLVSQFDTPEVIVGHMTIALELLDQVPEMDTLIIPLSGGGLLVGLGLVMKRINPDCRIIGVTMERGAAMYHCLESGRPHTVLEELTLADSLGGGVTEWTFTQTQNLITEVVLVSEEEIYRAIHDIYHQDGLVVEGAATVGVAALQSGKIKPRKKTVCVLSGNNIDRDLHKKIINQETVMIEKNIQGQTKSLTVNYVYL